MSGDRDRGGVRRGGLVIYRDQTGRGNIKDSSWDTKTVLKWKVLHLTLKRLTMNYFSKAKVNY